MSTAILLVAAFFIGSSSTTLLKDVPWNQLKDLDFSQTPKDVQDEIGQVLAHSMLQFVDEYGSRFRIDIGTKDDQGQIKTPIDIGALPELIELPDVHWTEEVGGPSSGLIVGDLHICEPVVTGLDTLVMEVTNTISLRPLGAQVNVDVRASPKIAGSHSLGGAFLLGLFRIESFGYFEAGIQNGYLGLGMEVRVNKSAYFNVTKVTFDLDLDRLYVHADRTVFNGVEVNWEVFSDEITETFLILWPAAQLLVNKHLGPPIAKVLNQFVGNCGVHHIFQIMNGDFSCLGIEGIGGKEVTLQNMLTSDLRLLLEGRSNTESCDVQYTLPPPTTTTTTTTTEKTPEGSAAHAQTAVGSLILVTVAMLRLM